MKRIALNILSLSIALTALAQNQITVAEPEFRNSYIHLTSDSTFSKLPKETAQFKKHESKTSKFAKLASGVASVAGSVGMGSALGGNIGAAVGAILTMSTASSVASAAGTLDMLAGYNGMDIVFDGKESEYSIPFGSDVRIIYKAESNETDPMDFLRVVQFKKGKKDRRIQWMTVTPSLLGSAKERKNGYLPFEAKKFGESSYLITIPAESLEVGEYGIVSPSMVESTVIPIATFSIK